MANALSCPYFDNNHSIKTSYEIKSDRMDGKFDWTPVCDKHIEAYREINKSYPGMYEIRPYNQVSKVDTTNPKDLLGAKKVSISKLPFVAILHGAHAMMNGAAKYGPFNWRSKKVQADIYIDAAIRHLSAWFEGEEIAEDSGVHHLGHAIACCAILLDAQETGNLVDNRPGNGKFNEVLARLNDMIKKRSQNESSI